MIDESSSITPAPARWSAGRHAAVVLALTVVAAGIRLYHLDQPSMWYDEVRTVHGAITGQEGWSKTLGYLPNRFWLMMQGIELSPELAEQPERWRGLGIDERAARLPSCLLGIITVPVLYVLACRVLGPQVALVAALLLAFNTWHVYWSQTARFYTLQFLLYNCSLLLYLRWWQTNRSVMAALAIITFVLAVLSQPTAVVLLGVFVLDGIVRLVAKRDRQATVRVGAGLVIAGVLVGAAIGVDIMRRPEQWAHFLEKANLPPGRLVTSGGYFIGPAVVVAALLAAWMAFRNHRRSGITLLVAALLPIIAFSAFGLFGRVELRYCLVCLYAWLCLAAMIGVMHFATGSPKLGRLGAVATIACLLGSELVPLYDYINANGLRPYTREAVEFVQRARRPGELIFMDTDEGSYYFQERLAGDAPAAAVDAGGHRPPAWIIYRDDWRGTIPPPQEWVKENTELRAVFGYDGIGRMGRVYVRYRP